MTDSGLAIYVAIAVALVIAVLVFVLARKSRSKANGVPASVIPANASANAEAIELGVFTPAEFDFGRFKGTAPFTLDLAALTDAYWTAGTALARNIGEVRELIMREMAAGRTVIGEFGQAY